MTLTVTHAKVSAIADDATASAAGEVLPSDWNDNHVVTGDVSFLARLQRSAAKIYNGASVSGPPPNPVLSLSLNTLIMASFGDSVGNSKPQYLSNRLVRAFGGGYGGFLNGTLSGTAAQHTDVNDCSYWINGSWYTISGGAGSILFKNASGGDPYCTKLKIYYVKRSGAGTFKVQVDGLDDATYTNVDCNNATTTAGVITITVSAGTHNIGVVRLTGSVEFIGAASVDESQAGLRFYDITAAGLEIATSATTPTALVNVVLNDIAPDLCTMEWKDTSAFTAAFTSFMANATGQNWGSQSDWIMIGTTPVSDPGNDAQNVINNAQMNDWADANARCYFDGYNVFSGFGVSAYQRLVDLGWNNDGTHPAQACQVYLSSLLYEYCGFDALFQTYATRDVVANNVYALTKVSIGSQTTPSGVLTVNGSNATELKVQTSGNVKFYDFSNNVFAQLGGFSGGGNTYFLPAGGKVGINTDSPTYGLSAVVDRIEAVGNPAVFQATCNGSNAANRSWAWSVNQFGAGNSYYSISVSAARLGDPLSGTEGLTFNTTPAHTVFT